MEKLSILVVCGPTATGKTQLALQLAHLFHGDLISADSRQIYQGMDIGTGKDIPSGSLPPHSLGEPYLYQDIRIYGYDLVKPDQSYSLANYYSYVWQEAIPRIQSAGRLPILVGGTGLYLKSIFEPPATASIPQNLELRLELQSASVAQLQTKLIKINPEKYSRLNSSDVQNPRRLLRAIEVSLSPGGKSPLIPPPPNRSLWLGLTAPITILEKKLIARVAARANSDFTQEVNQLIKQYPDFATLPAFSATGYREWQAYLSGVISRDQAINRWLTREKQYLRRQFTYFKALPFIRWIDLTQPDFESAVAHQVKSWYPKKDA